MKWLPLKSLVLALPLVAVTSTAAADYGSPEAVLSSCKDVLQNESAVDGGGQCLDSITGYLNAMNVAENGARLQQPEQSGEPSGILSNLEQRAIDTRAGGYMDRFNRMASETACGLKQNERVTQIMSDLGVTTEQWQALVDSANGLLGREGVC